MTGLGSIISIMVSQINHAIINNTLLGTIGSKNEPIIAGILHSANLVWLHKLIIELCLNFLAGKPFCNTHLGYYLTAMPPYFTSEHTYTANYCEENVYYLCRKFLALNESQLEDDAKAEITPPASEVYAVFITNEWSSVGFDCSK